MTKLSPLRSLFAITAVALASLPDHGAELGYGAPPPLRRDRDLTPIYAATARVVNAPKLRGRRGGVLAGGKFCRSCGGRLKGAADSRNRCFCNEELHS